jgi:hypothetical protein
MMRKSFQLGLIRMAVAVTLVPINSTPNRIMIKELSLPATLVVLLASLPYVFSPLQVIIGSYSDRHPLRGSILPESGLGDHRRGQLEGTYHGRHVGPDDLRNHCHLSCPGSLARSLFATRTSALVYLSVLLSAVLGQDLLLEPFAGEVLGMPVSRTTRLTAIWGGCFLLSMVAGSILERRVAKKRSAGAGACVAATALLLLVVAGFLRRAWLFYFGTVLLGLGSGLSTLANLSLMLDMVPPGNKGLYMGLWGIASAVARSTVGALDPQLFQALD